jgi:hypothetical protein
VTKTIPPARPAWCNTCRNTVPHLVHGHQQFEDSDEDGALERMLHFYMLECSICSSMTMLRFFDWARSYEATRYDETYFPPKQRRAWPEWCQPLDFIHRGHFVYALLEEIYGALAHQHLRLVAAGVRSLVEQAMIECVGDKGTFGKTTEAFMEAEWVGRKDMDRLIVVINAGSAALHRNHVPTDAEANTMLDIAEHLILSVYVHTAPAEALARRIPSRPRLAKPSE